MLSALDFAIGMAHLESIDLKFESRSRDLDSGEHITRTQAMRDEPHFHARFVESILPRLRRAPRAGFEQIRPQVQVLQLTPVGFDGGSTTTIMKQHHARYGFITDTELVPVRECPKMDT